MAQAQAHTQLTLFTDPQSSSLKRKHGSGAEGSKCSLVAWVKKVTLNEEKGEVHPGRKDKTFHTNVVAKVVLIVRETDVDGYICQATSRKRDRESCSQRSQNTENESKSIVDVPVPQGADR